MSKPMVGVILFVLISFALIAATSVDVRGWLAGSTSGVAGAQSHEVTGLQTNFNHDRSTVAELERFKMQGAGPSLDKPGRGHGCESDARVIPQD